MNIEKIEKEIDALIVEYSRMNSTNDPVGLAQLRGKTAMYAASLDKHLSEALSSYHAAEEALEDKQYEVREYVRLTKTGADADFAARKGEDTKEARKSFRSAKWALDVLKLRKGSLDKICDAQSTLIRVLENERKQSNY